MSLEALFDTCRYGPLLGDHFPALGSGDSHFEAQPSQQCATHRITRANDSSLYMRFVGCVEGLVCMSLTRRVVLSVFDTKLTVVQFPR